MTLAGAYAGYNAKYTQVRHLLSIMFLAAKLMGGVGIYEYY